MHHRSDASQQPNCTFPLTCLQFGLAHTKIQVSRGFHSGSLSDVEESTAISFWMTAVSLRNKAEHRATFATLTSALS